MIPKPECDKPIDQTTHLAGSTQRYTHWVLIEDRSDAEWGPYAVEDAATGGPLAELLGHLDRVLPGARTLLIRQPNPEPGPPHRIFICDGQNPHFYQGTFTPGKTIHLSLGKGFEPPKINDEPMTLMTEPLYAVCTNMQRDCRCGTLGTPVLEALQAQGANAWSVTHIAGHKYAATLYTFPYAMCYGRVTVEDVPLLIERVQAGRLLLDKVRGRGTISGEAQATEVALLRHLGKDGVNDFMFIGEAPDDDAMTVWGSILDENAHIYRMTVERDNLGLSVTKIETYTRQ